MLSVRTKITIFGFITIVLSVLIGYLVVTPLLVNVEKEQYIDEVKGQYDIYSNNIEHFQNDIRYSILLFQQNDEIYTDSSDFTNYMTAFDDGFTYDPTEEEQSIILSMFDYALINRNVESIYIGYDDTGALVRTTPIQENHDPGEAFNYDPRERQWYTNAVNANGGVVFNEIEKHPTQNSYFSTISTAMYDLDEEFIGVLGVDIDFETYMENFTQVESLSRGEFIYTQGDKAVLINDDDSIEILEINDVYDGLDAVLDYDGFNTIELELDGTNYLVIISHFEDSSIRLVHLISDSAMNNLIMSKVTTIRTLFIVITLVLIVAMLIVQEYIVLRPLGSIHDDIKHYKESNIYSSFRFLEEGSKEFIQITTTLNDMVDTINTNMSKMSERMNEMNCLYEVTNLSYRKETIDDILEGTVHAIVPAMKYPEDAAVHISFKNKQFYSKEFEPTQWLLSVELKSNKGVQGSINVYYLSEKPEEDIGPFENEELKLLESVANTLQIALTYRKEAVPEDSKKQ